jgi:hypothetical protein
VIRRMWKVSAQLGPIDIFPPITPKDVKGSAPLYDCAERTGSKLVLQRGGPTVVADLATPRSEAPSAVAPHAATHSTLVSLGSYLASPSATAFAR